MIVLRLLLLLLLRLLLRCLRSFLGCCGLLLLRAAATSAAVPAAAAAAPLNLTPPPGSAPSAWNMVSSSKDRARGRCTTILSSSSYPCTRLCTSVERCGRQGCAGLYMNMPLSSSWKYDTTLVPVVLCMAAAGRRGRGAEASAALQEVESAGPAPRLRRQGARRQAHACGGGGEVGACVVTPVGGRKAAQLHRAGGEAPHKAACTSHPGTPAGVARLLQDTTSHSPGCIAGLGARLPSCCSSRRNGEPTPQR
jgi:hypothetical protein